MPHTATHKPSARSARPGRPSAHPDHANLMRDCASTCNQTLAYCLQQGGKHVEADHIKALVDCIQVCSIGSDLVGRGSPLADAYMKVTAQACRTCQESCKAFTGDEQMQACAEACRTCAEACES